MSDHVRDRIYLGTALNGVRDALDLDPDVDEKTYHKHVRKLKADLAAARAALKRYETALRVAKVAFRQYETHHRAKGADEKAMRNKVLADMCEAALSQPNGRLNRR